MPDLTVVKDGVIVAHDDETALVESDQKADSYWTQDKINEFRFKITEYVNLLK